MAKILRCDRCKEECQPGHGFVPTMDRTVPWSSEDTTLTAVVDVSIRQFKTPAGFILSGPDLCQPCVVAIAKKALDYKEEV